MPHPRFETYEYNVDAAAMKGTPGFATLIRMLDGADVFIICPKAEQLARVFDHLRPDAKFDPVIVQRVVVVSQARIQHFAVGKVADES